MTREEAIRTLKYNSNVIHQTINGETDPNEVEALEMAIEALEQETCEDVISRQAAQIELTKCEVIDAYDENDNLVGCYNADTVDSIVRNLPPVTPQQKYGKWVRIDKDKCKCDQCEVISFVAMYPNGDANYCPNCGCRMIEPQESEDKG